MKTKIKYKALFNKLMFVFIMVLALSGLGIGAVFLPNQKMEQEQMNDVNIEMIDQLNDTENEDSLSRFKS